jgi:hypothetical protein
MLPILALLFAPAVEAQNACPMGAAWGAKPSSADIRNVLSRSRGSLTWNNVPVSDEALRQYLRNAARISPLPEMVVDTTGLSCAERQRIATEVEAAYPCTPDFCRAYDVVRQPLAPAPPRRR